MKPCRFVALACVLSACGGDAMTGVDASTDDAVRPDAPPGCTRPNLDATWLPGLLSGAVMQLAGTPRSTTTQRNGARAVVTNWLASLDLTAQQQQYSSGANVFVTIPSTTGSTQQIIVGAHFDTVTGSPGANDNATGCAVVLAIARYLKDVPCRTVNVTLVYFDEEEAGLFGSRAFAAAQSNVIAVHTIDQVGWDNDGDHRFELERPTAALEAQYRAAATIVGVPVTTTNTSGTDHQSFRDRNMPAIGITEEFVGGDTSPFRHTAQDTPSTVNTDYLVLAAKLVGQVVIDEVSP